MSKFKHCIVGASEYLIFHLWVILGLDLAGTFATLQAKEKSPLGKPLGGEVVDPDGEEEEEGGSGLASNGKPMLRYLWTHRSLNQPRHGQAHLLAEGCGGRGGDGAVLGQGDHLLGVLLQPAERGRPHLLGDDPRRPSVPTSRLCAQHNPESPVLPVPPTCALHRCKGPCAGDHHHHRHHHSHIRNHHSHHHHHDHVFRNAWSPSSPATCQRRRRSSTS